MSEWFHRKGESITTPTEEKKDSPDGLWHLCPKCKVMVDIDEHEAKLWVCGNCGHHNGIDAAEYFSFLFDGGQYTELDANLVSADPLKFVDTKAYSDRLKATRAKTGLTDALTSGTGNLDGMPVTIAAMNFKFIGGSMGSVVGEKIARAIDHAALMRLTFPEREFQWTARDTLLYNPTGCLPANTTIYVNITPYNADGDAVEIGADLVMHAQDRRVARCAHHKTRRDHRAIIAGLGINMLDTGNGLHNGFKRFRHQFDSVFRPQPIGTDVDVHHRN